MIVAKAPTRIDLAGGTLDLWPIHCLLDNPATVNVAIDLFAEVEIEERKDKAFSIQSLDQGVAIDCTFSDLLHNSKLPLLTLLVGKIWSSELPGLRISTKAKSPAGAGLGGSSCLGITLASGLIELKRKYDPMLTLAEYQLVELVQNIEAKIIHAPTGIQDYWAAVRGGVNIITYPAFGTKVTTVSDEIQSNLSNYLIACYSGQSRASALNNWQIFKAIFDGDRNMLEHFQEIGALAQSCAQTLLKNDIQSALGFSQKEWEKRKKLWPNIETDTTKNIENAALRAGADFARVCGAGGGGVMAIVCQPEKRKLVITAVEKSGGKVLDTSIASRGVEVFSKG